MVTQQARQLTWTLAEHPESFRFLIRDRDKKFTDSFDEVFRGGGLDIIRTPFRAPQANGVAERFVRTVRSECLDCRLILNNQHLERVLDVFVERYNGHRPHRALALTPPPPARPPVLPVTAWADARVQRRDRLRWCGSRVRPGGMIRFVNPTGCGGWPIRTETGRRSTNGPSHAREPVSQDRPAASGFGVYCAARMRRTTSLFMGMPKAKVIGCAMRGQPQVGLRCLVSTTAAMSSRLGPFGPGFFRVVHENSRRYFRVVGAIEHQQLLRTRTELGRHGSRSVRTREPGDGRQEVKKEDGQVAHGTIVTS